MADKLLKVNMYVSVMASRVTAVTTKPYSEGVQVHTDDGQIHELDYSDSRFEAKRKFEQQVNDAVAGD